MEYPGLESSLDFATSLGFYHFLSIDKEPWLKVYGYIYEIIIIEFWSSFYIYYNLFSYLILKEIYKNQKINLDS